ncbi:hypothetical protein RugamoR64_50950 [Duganella rhizosphaerae]|uniref:hypothetical protein n=1 Tax=Duganella rhizosphaerae TaxID=2885763 RepID=UPI0030EA9CB9
MRTGDALKVGRVVGDIALSFVVPMWIWLAYLEHGARHESKAALYGEIAVGTAALISAFGLYRLTSSWPLLGRIVFGAVSLLFLFGVFGLLAAGALLAGATTMP